MDVPYTRISGEILNWDRFRPLRVPARFLYIALSISPRRALIGLWNAGVGTIADVAKMQPDDALVALDELLEADLIEFDRAREVLRLTEFPDRSERPQNGRYIRHLWTRFRAVPQCQIRDAHVHSLRWLLEDPLRPPTEDHVKAWSETFGTISVPPQRRRGVRRLLDSDTSTSAQGSLFTNPTAIVSIATKPDTVCDTVSDTHRSEIIDLGSGSLRSGSPPLALSAGSGSESTGHATAPATVQIPGQAEAARTPLTLVPLPEELPFSTADMLTAIASESGGRFAPGPVDSRLVPAILETIRRCHEAEVGLDDLRDVGRWLAAGGLGYRSDLGPVWVAKPGALFDAVGLARVWKAKGGGVVGYHGGSPRQEPAPVGAHSTGKRRL